MHYPADSGDGRTLYQGSGKVEGANADTFTYTFENFKLTEHGSSGGGIYRFDSATGERRVVGVVSRGDATRDTNPYIDEVWGPALTDWLDDYSKPSSLADVVDYDWFFDKDSGTDSYKPWMRTNNPFHSGVSSSKPLSGSNFSVTANLYNTGTEDASGVKVSFYLSTNDTITSSDILLGSRFVDVAESDWSTTTWNGPLPSGLTGSYYVGWRIDPDNTLSEYGYGGSDANVGHYPTAINIQAVPDHLAFSSHPSSGTAGQTLSPSVTVRVLDVNGSLVSNSNISVTLSLNSSNGATLGGTTTVSAVNGIATFSNLLITKAGSGYTLVATTSSVSGAISNSFSINAAAAHHLAFGQQPSTVLVGSVINPAVQVRLLDIYGNLITGNSATITMTLGNARGAVLGGSTSTSTFGGVATFSNLQINRANTGYTLIASCGVLGGATSLVFTVDNHAPVMSSQVSTLWGIKEDNRSSYGTPIKSLLAKATDADAGALQGVAITAVTGAANGVWQFTLDDGKTWQALGAVSVSAARLLPANSNASRVRFVPNPNFNGKVSLSYAAWDKTQGDAGGLWNLSTAGSRGGMTAFSTATCTATLTIQPVNDPPVVGVSGSIGYKLNSSPVLLASAATVTDVDSKNFAKGMLKLSITSGADASNRLTIGGSFKVTNGQVWLGTTFIGAVNSGGGVGTVELRINLSANATPAVTQQLLRSITFSTVGSANKTPRVVSFTVLDGAGGTSAMKTRTVNIF